MAKKSKPIQRDRYSMQDCQMRPVTKSDKWCRKWLNKGQIPIGDAPWGYIVTIPYIPNQNTLLENMEEYYIVRCKKHCGNLFLQIVKRKRLEKREYGIKSFARNEPKASKKKRKNKKKLYRILNVRNFKKTDSNFTWRSEEHVW